MTAGFLINPAVFLYIKTSWMERYGRKSALTPDSRDLHIKTQAQLLKVVCVSGNHHVDPAALSEKERTAFTQACASSRQPVKQAFLIALSTQKGGVSAWLKER